LNDPETAGIRNPKPKGRKTMTKTELISNVAKEAKITKAAAARAVDCITNTITKDLKKGGKITLPGFGTFSVGKRKARTGRNPATGETIKIRATKTAKFKPGKALKEAVRYDRGGERSFNHLLN